MPTIAISLKGPDEAALRSILNPVSFPLLSIQFRFIWLEDIAVAVRLLGADGIGIAVVVVVRSVVVVVDATEVELVVGLTDVVEVVVRVEVVLVVIMTEVVVETTTVVVIMVISHTSPNPSPSLSRWSLIHNPLEEQPIAQSVSLVQIMPGLSEVDEQLPRFGPLGLSGQLSSMSTMPSLSVSGLPTLKLLFLNIGQDPAAFIALRQYTFPSSLPK